MTSSHPLIIYKVKDSKEEEAFDALERLAAMGSLVPDKGEQKAYRWRR